MINKKHNLKNKIMNTIEHSYLQQFIVPPYMDEEKLLLLIEMVEALDLSDELKEKLVITTTIIQMALDTHEAVKNESLHGVEFKAQQLSILAGVYYSGLYYKLLADIDDTYYTRKLAIAIKEVNEHKITLYQSVEKRHKQVFEDLMVIESALIDKFSQNVSKYWFDLSRNFLLLKRLIKEKEQYTTTGHSPMFKALYLIESKKDSLETINDEEKQLLFKIFDQKMDLVKQNINKCLENIDDITPVVKDTILSKLV